MLPSTDISWNLSINPLFPTTLCYLSAQVGMGRYRQQMGRYGQQMGRYGQQGVNLHKWSFQITEECNDTPDCAGHLNCQIPL